MNWKNHIITIGCLLLLLVGVVSTDLNTQIIKEKTKEQVQFNNSFTSLSSLLPIEPLPNFQLSGDRRGKTSSSSFEWADLQTGNIFLRHEIAYSTIQNLRISHYLPFSTNKLFLKHGVLLI